MHNVIVLGLDGAPWKLIKPWIEEGKLPFFKKVIKNGVYGTVRSTIPPLTSPALPSLYTGLNPGKLGLFDFMKDGRVISSKDIPSPTIWDYLNKDGKKPLIFNMPITYPPGRSGGDIVSGYPIPGRKSEFTYPESIKREFDIPMDLVDIRSSDFPDYNYEYLIENQTKITKSRFNIFRTILEREKFGFAMFFVKGTDILQHYLWNSKRFLEDYYTFLDRELAKICDGVPDWNVFIFSDHGFETAPTRNFHVNTWLQKEGYLKMKGGKIGGQIIAALISYASRIVPQKVKLRAVKNSITKGKEGKTKPRTLLPGVDWESTTAYKDRLGISINREVCEERYETIREEIIKKLLKLKDRDGKNIIQEAWKREEIYSGHYVKDVPDIVIVTDGDYSTTPIPSRHIVSGRKKRVITGAHHSALEGIFIAYGPDIKSGEKINRMSILDIAPTILHMYGIPIPRDMDGRVLKEIFKEGSSHARREVLYEDEEIDREKVLIERAIDEMIADFRGMD